VQDNGGRVLYGKHKGNTMGNIGEDDITFDIEK
jgi:hypothetical protein